MTSGVRLLVLGKQGAGKGTQAVRIARNYGVPHISTGDMFRAASAAGTPFGLKAKEFMKRGELVPDDIVIGVVAERLAKDDVVDDGFVLDGFPRTRVQAEELHRISGRRVCRTCGATYHVDKPPKVDWLCDRDGGSVVQRDDDKPEAIERRLELYEQETGPLLEFYEALGLLVTVDGVGDLEDVFGRVLDGVETVRQ